MFSLDFHKSEEKTLNFCLTLSMFVFKLFPDRRLSIPQLRPDRLLGRRPSEDLAPVQRTERLGRRQARHDPEQQHLRRVQRNHQRVERTRI